MRALLVAVALSGAAAAYAAPVAALPSVFPVQQLQRDAGPRATASTEHFEISYSPERLSAEQVAEAGRLAEGAWKKCEALFLGKPANLTRIRLNLTPNFQGATGFATPSSDEDGERNPLIGVRYAELEYLGPTAEYVLTHEVAHVFSGASASTSLGEGIADWAAGEYSGLPMRPWWGVTLREAGLWIDPEAFFITGEFEARPEVDEVIRTAQYVESGLLVRYLVGRFGWARVREFAKEYNAARGRLNSNEDRAALPVPRNPRSRASENDPRRPPDATAVRAAFQKTFGESWERLREGWEREMTSEAPSRDQAERLVLGQRIYGSVRNFEMWALRQRGLSSEVRSVVQAAFTDANRSLARGDLASATAAYERARVMVERLRRPQIVT